MHIVNIDRETGSKRLPCWYTVSDTAGDSDPDMVTLKTDFLKYW